MRKYATVLAVYRNQYKLFYRNKIFFCQIAGRFFSKEKRSPVVVGDVVEIDENNLIVSVKARKNLLGRKSKHNIYHQQVLFANIDLLAIVSSVKQPSFKFQFIDRMLVLAKYFNIEPMIVINKIDLANSRFTLPDLYKDLGINVFYICANTGQGIDEFKKGILKKKTAIVGQSGVGKTSIINRIIPELNLKTSEVHKQTGKGKHTTTVAEMFHIKGGGFIVDSQGIKSIGLMYIDNNELAKYFIEFRKFLPYCQFANCSHIHEPNCAIKKAVEQGKIAKSRYRSYVMIYYNK